MNNGWIKLHRKLLDHPLYSKPEFVSIWVTMLLHATHKEMKIDWCGETVILNPGQFVGSYDKLSAVTGVTYARTRKIIKRLEIDRQIDRQTSNKSTLFTIINWEDYQKEDRQADRQKTDSAQATNRQKTANKNDKKVKNEKNKHIEFSRSLVEKIKSSRDYWRAGSMPPKEMEKAAGLCAGILTKGFEPEEMARIVDHYINGYKGGLKTNEYYYDIIRFWGKEKEYYLTVQDDMGNAPPPKKEIELWSTGKPKECPKCGAGTREHHMDGYTEYNCGSYMNARDNHLTNERC